MRLIVLFLTLIALIEAKHCTFIPPAGWEIAQLKNPSPHVKIGFVGKGTGEFRPSINLAIEEVDVSLKEYVKAVKELQLADPTTQWRDLGKFQMAGGEGRLTEMTSKAPWGEIKILQAFLVANDRAYILTSAVLRADFLKFQNELLKAFQSLNLVEELWTPIADAAKRNEFQSLFTSLSDRVEKQSAWEKVQKEVASNSSLGSYWQYLALKEGHAKIFTKGNP